MTTRTTLLVSACLVALSPLAHAQQHEAHAPAVRGAAPGQFPSGPPHGPAPARARPPEAMRPPEGRIHGAVPVPERQPPPPQRVEVERPHVEHDARWVGHESGPHDARYHVDHPWAHGKFRRPTGRGHVYRINGWDAPRRRFWFGNSYFVIGEPDWGYVNDWDWANDQVVLYDDPDHPGWYLAYNVRLGTYAHVQYDGAE